MLCVIPRVSVLGEYASMAVMNDITQSCTSTRKHCGCTQMEVLIQDTLLGHNPNEKKQTLGQ